MADYLPKYGDDNFTIDATATIVGGNMVTAGGTVAGATALDWIGVAGHDTVTGRKLTVWSEGVQYCVASAAIAVGASIKCAAAGQIAGGWAVADGANAFVGIALSAASAQGDVIAVKFAR